MDYKEKIIKLGFKYLEDYNNIFVNNNLSINYSDGEIEEEILKILKREISKSLNPFPLLEKHIVNWPTEYHLSWVRQNILKPINFSMEDVVLELGGGTGIISEYIVNKTKKLITIEGTAIRAKSIATRCSKFDNIDIIVADFLELDLLETFGENSFSKIVLIGVLEYVPKYSKNKREDSINKLLIVCRKLLKPNGQLIIAIENKIGLKYLLGSEEDHIGVRHYGTQSLYRKNDVNTFTKKQLENKLNIAGYKYIDWYYPFPDYKLPQVIIKEGFNLKSPDSKQLIASLLTGIKTRNYSGKNKEDLFEGRILNNFIEDEILGNISNSFLLIAGKNEIEEKPTPFSYYFSSSRKHQFSNEILFTNTKEGIIVTKKWNGKSTKGKLINYIANSETKHHYIKGELLGNVLVNYYLLKDKENYLLLLNKWVKLLVDNIGNYENSFDLIPSNVILNEEGKFIFFDYNEWATDVKFTVPQIIKRYVVMNKIHFVWLFGKQENIDDYVYIISEKNDLNLILNEDLKLNEVEKVHNYIEMNIFGRNYLRVDENQINQKINIWKKWIILIIPPLFINTFKKNKKNISSLLQAIKNI